MKTSTTELTQQSWKICWKKMKMMMIQDPMLPTVAQDNQVAERHGDGASVTDSDRSTESSGLRRSTRVSRPVERYQAHQKRVTFASDPVIMKKMEEAYNIASDPDVPPKTFEYGWNAAQVAAKFMVETHDKVLIQGASYAQQYSLKKGLQKFGKKGSEAITKELDQLHKRSCFVPVDVSKLTSGEKKKAQHALDVIDGETRWICQRAVRVQWKANKTMAGQRRRSKSYGVDGKHYADCYY